MYGSYFNVNVVGDSPQIVDCIPSAKANIEVSGEI